MLILRLKDEGQKRMTQGGASEVWWGLATCLRLSMQAGWVENALKEVSKLNILTARGTCPLRRAT